MLICLMSKVLSARVVFMGFGTLEDSTLSWWCTALDESEGRMALLPVFVVVTRPNM